MDYILAQALRWHVSSVNIKSSAIPPEWKSAFDEFQKKMGYRFESCGGWSIRPSVTAGTMPPFNMWWLNAGVAPVYRPYELALRFHGESDAAVELPADLRKWLPGDALFEEPVPIPKLPAGKYRVQTAMLDPRTHQLAIALGIAGRGADGWYDLGEIAVEEARAGR